jgi:hypothetical protein
MLQVKLPGLLINNSYNRAIVTWMSTVSYKKSLESQIVAASLTSGIGLCHAKQRVALEYSTYVTTTDCKSSKRSEGVKQQKPATLSHNIVWGI